MKIRKGFVSNSSSSSFICDVCGNIEAGWDMSIDEADMVECVKGHVLCKDHIINKEKFSKWEEENDDYWGYEIPEDFCPICQFNTISQKDIIKFMLKRLHFSSMNELKKHVVEEYMTKEEFDKFIE